MAHGPTPVLFRIAPNPASRFALLHTSGTIEIKVYDVAGSFVATIKIKSNSAETKLDLSGLQAGVYFLKAVGEQNTNVQKLVILH